MAILVWSNVVECRAVVWSRVVSYRLSIVAWLAAWLVGWGNGCAPRGRFYSPPKTKLITDRPTTMMIVLVVTDKVQILEIYKGN